MFKPLIALAGLAVALGAHAQADYPNKPIRFVSISTAGSGGDTITRLFAEKMGPLLGTTLFVDNKPGAGGAIASDIVAKAPADGYTILLGGMTSHVLLPAVRPRLSYDTVRDFEPIGSIGTAAILLAAVNDFPANNVQELVALAKKDPGQLMYASWGIGSTGHFCGELLAQVSQIKWEHVPYKGVGPIQNDLLGGQLKLAFVDMATGSPMVKAGRVKALGSCVSRSPSLPEVRGYDEDGINYAGKSVIAPMWAMYAPAGTPRPAMDKLIAAMKQVVEMPDVRERLLTLGVTAGFIPGPTFKTMLAEGIPQWREIAQKSNIVID